MCGQTIRATLDDPTDADIAQLWQELDDAARDAFHGPGGQALMPVSSTQFTFVKADRGGYSAGYDVRGPDGMSWHDAFRAAGYDADQSRRFVAKIKWTRV